MRKYIVFIFILFQTVPCLCQQTLYRELMHDGIPRQYKVYKPAAYTGQSPWPVVYCIHGYTMTIDNQISMTAMNSVADTGHFFVVYPQGLMIPSQWSMEGLPATAPGWNYGGLSETDDFGFISRLMDTIENSFNIDRSRVYLAGISNGTQMSYALTCRFPERIAAIAGVVGKMVDTIYSQCTDAQAKPVMTIHGTVDPCVDYYEDPGALETVKFWRQRADCDTTPVVTSLPDVYLADKTTLTEFRYAGCAYNIEIVHLRMNGGGHVWPGKPAYELNGQVNYDIDGSSYIWNFLRKYSLATTGLGSKPGNPGHIHIYPNPTNTYLTIETGISGLYKIDITSLNGQLILSKEMDGSGHHIDITSFQEGVYFITVRSRDQVWTEKIIKLWFL